jgi:hypothetical protein
VQTTATHRWGARADIVFRRGLSCAAIAVAVAACAHGERLGLDFWRVNEHQDRLARHEREAAELERKHEIVLARGAARRRLNAALSRGEITLEAAAQSYLDLNRSDPVALWVMRKQFPGETDFDCALNQVRVNLANCQRLGGYELAARERAKRKAGQ